jgi:hypothetical protein
MRNGAICLASACPVRASNTKSALQRHGSGSLGSYSFRLSPPAETVAKWSDVPAFVHRRSLAGLGESLADSRETPGDPWHLPRVDLVELPSAGAGWGLAKPVEQIPRA